MTGQDVRWTIVVDGVVRGGGRGVAIPVNEQRPRALRVGGAFVLVGPSPDKPIDPEEVLAQAQREPVYRVTKVRPADQPDQTAAHDVCVATVEGDTALLKVFAGVSGPDGFTPVEDRVVEIIFSVIPNGEREGILSDVWVQRAESEGDEPEGGISNWPGETLN